VAVAAVAVAVEDQSAMSAEEIAKSQWLAKLDAPVWVKSAVTMAEVASQATQIQALSEACESGVDEACDSLSKEETAKRDWLAKLDVSSWGAAAAAVSAVASGVVRDLPIEQAPSKAAWLARLDVPPWGPSPAPFEPTSELEAKHDVPTWHQAAAPSPTLSEEAAKRAWLGKLDVPSWGAAAATVTAAVAEIEQQDALTLGEEAKRAWLAKLDAPTWSKGSSPAVTAVLSQKISEDEAKKSWLSKLDAPTWGAAAAAVSAVATTVDDTALDAAKQAWLERFDSQTWNKAASVMLEVAQQATEMAKLQDACDDGDDVACDHLSQEEEAKRSWLGRLDVPTWGAAAAAVSAAAAGQA